ncbi:MAG: C-GCAxxG-C-C family protein [Candidatus Bathyarchaeia archaeon]
MLKSRDKQELLEEVSKLAYGYEKEFGGCSQAVLKAVQEVCEFQDNLLFKSAYGFAGGIGLAGSVCGALAGGVMVLGLKHGRSLSNHERWNVDTRLKQYEIFRDFYKWFRDEYGSVYCRDLIGYDLTQRQKRDEFHDSPVFEQCLKRVASVARKAADMIIEESK